MTGTRERSDEPDLLAAVLAAARRIVEVRAGERPRAELERAVAAMRPLSGRFRAALERRDRPNLIAECKRRSPAGGVLRRHYDPAAIAAAYQAAGAAAISVLTEPAFFDGSLDHLREVRLAVSVPLLRKDFVVDDYQLLEARAAGADAVLLMVAALEPRALRRLLERAVALGLDVLVEVHDERELERAFEAGATVIGVNNRNLRTLQVDLDTSLRLIDRIPADLPAVAESGVRTTDDIARLSAAGYRAFLVGERLMTSPDPGEALRDLLQTRDQGPEAGGRRLWTVD